MLLVFFQSDPLAQFSPPCCVCSKLILNVVTNDGVDHVRSSLYIHPVDHNDIFASYESNSYSGKDHVHSRLRPECLELFAIELGV